MKSGAAFAPITRWRSATGCETAARRGCNLTIAAKKDAHGNFDHFISVVEDIGKRHDAEEALQAALSASRTGTFRWNIVTSEIWWDVELRHIFGLPSAAASAAR